MQAQKTGVLFVVSGPSGVGKGTINRRLFEEFGERVAFSVSATTRGPREGEANGREYFFISRQEFEKRVANNEFLEHAQYAGNCYGTPRDYVLGLLERGVSVILEIDVQGAQQVKRSMPESVSVFILPPSYEELEHRLRGRGTETPEKIERRLAAAKREMEAASGYDYRIVNDDLDAAYAQLRGIFIRETEKANGRHERGGN